MKLVVDSIDAEERAELQINNQTMSRTEYIMKARGVGRDEAEEILKLILEEQKMVNEIMPEFQQDDGGNGDEE